MTEADDVDARLAALRSEVGDDVTVVLVTKGFGVESWHHALRNNVGVGENYAQELLAKENLLNGQVPPPLHFIGQLQRNKVKALAPLIDVWHTVDREALILELAKQAPGATVLIQVNLTADPHRGGCQFSEAPDLVAAGVTAGLAVAGLMTVGVADDLQASRIGYRKMRALCDDLALAHLSAGMSQDYRIAVDEGATIIRVGSAILGDRHYPEKA